MSCPDSYYTIDPNYLCTKSQHGYPEHSVKIYESIKNVPKPYKYHSCIPSTSNYDSRLHFEWSLCKGTIYSNAEGNFKIKGTVTNTGGKSILKYWAPAPNHCTYSTSGAGLPFPNEEIAFENTPNKGEIVLDSNGKFEIILKYPNGYYMNQGEIYIPPHINFMICGIREELGKVVKIQLPFDAPYRSLGFNLNDSKKEAQPIPRKYDVPRKFE